MVSHVRIRRVRSWIGLACAGVVTLAVVGGNAARADWPQWRGPERDAISKETGLLQEWPDGGPKLAWKAKGLGEGHATVAIAGNRMFTMGQDEETSYVHALDLNGGKIVWSTKVGKPTKPGGYVGPRCTPTVDADRVYALGQEGDLVCLNAADGKEVWRKNLRDDFKGKMMSGWGYSESPLIDGELMLCTPGGKDGTILALNKMTGEPVWRTTEFTDDAAYSSIIVREINGVRTYIQLTGEHVVGLDAKTGKVLWSGERSGKTAVIPTPVYHDNHVFVTSGYNAGGDLFKINHADGKFSVEKVYHTNDLGVHIGGVVLLDGHLYGANNTQLMCIDFLTGKVKWKNRSVGKSAVTYADGRLYVRSDAQPGKIALVEVNPEKYVERGEMEQPDGSGLNTWSPPVIVDGKMYLRDMDVLLCYDVKRNETARADR